MNAFVDIASSKLLAVDFLPATSQVRFSTSSVHPSCRIIIDILTIHWHPVILTSLTLKTRIVFPSTGEFRGWTYCISVYAILRACLAIAQIVMSDEMDLELIICNMYSLGNATIACNETVIKFLRRIFFAGITIGILFSKGRLQLLSFRKDIFTNPSDEQSSLLPISTMTIAALSQSVRPS